MEDLCFPKSAIDLAQDHTEITSKILACAEKFEIELIEELPKLHIYRVSFIV